MLTRGESNCFVSPHVRSVAAPAKPSATQSQWEAGGLEENTSFFRKLIAQTCNMQLYSVGYVDYFFFTEVIKSKNFRI
jgi:hypothetical protein